MDDAKLELLHDHHKDSFSRIRERESQRDRLFLVLVGLYALLTIQIQYPLDFNTTIDTITPFGVEISVESLPFAALLSATWLFTAAIALRYFTTSTNIERQYDYLHKIEEAMSPEFEGDIYRRESREYTERYPLLQSVAWRSYTLLFPIVALLATSFLLAEELRNLDYFALNKVLDSVIAVYLLMLVLAYTLAQIPPAKSLGNAIVKRYQARKSNKHPQNSDYSEDE